MTRVMTKPKPRILIQFACTAKEKRAIQRAARFVGENISVFMRIASERRISNIKRLNGLRRRQAEAPISACGAGDLA